MIPLVSEGPSEFEVLLEQARIQTGQQDASLEVLRTRVTAVISISAIVAALFAPHFLSHLTGLAVAALVALLITVVLGILILMPLEWSVGVPLPSYHEWIKQHRKWREKEQPDAPDLGASLTEEIAATLVIAYERNRKKYETIATAYGVQVLALMVEVGLWIVAILVK
jgi:hypothetical protein